MNYLRPNIKRGNYSKEEQDLIIQLHKSLGNRWSIIAAHLPGRTDNEIKNHWHTYLKKRSKQNSTCDEPKVSSDDHSHGETSSTDQPSPLNPENHRILESCPLSPQLVSGEFSTSTTDSAGENGRELGRDDDVSPGEIFAEPVGDFWTEPFLEDDYNSMNDFVAPFVDPGLLYPPSPITGVEFSCSDGLYNDQNYALNW
ncbi:unnamed protein product [Ilex paraguariensis]|uniref:Uncharacterized protein n=1 Tax=Ilex paraguariensis TaxID=185542 RepID=A0ABC8SQ43_9AQUA